MRRRVRQRLLALLVLVALLLAAAFQYRADRARDPGTLLAIAPADVTRIDVTRGHGPTVHYRRRDGHWQRSDRPQATVDDGRLDELAHMAAVHVLEWRPLADFQPAHIGLTPPNLVLALDGHRLAFGALSAVGPQRYVQVGQRIALIPAIDTPRPPLADTVRKQL